MARNEYKGSIENASFELSVSVGGFEPARALVSHSDTNYGLKANSSKKDMDKKSHLGTFGKLRGSITGKA